MLSEESQEEKENDSLKDYALLVDPGRHSTDYVLYKPKYYAQRMKLEIQRAKKSYDDIKFKGDKFGNFKDYYGFSNVQQIFNDPRAIYAFLSINNGRILGLNGSCHRANEIRYVTARDGFGKLIFNIVLAKESPIMGNREEFPTAGYDELEKFSNNVQIEKEKFDNELSLHKKTAADCDTYGDNILDQSYKTKTDQSYQIQPLINRHKLFINQMKNFFKSNGVDYIQSRVKEYVADAGYLFFIEKKGDPSWYENFHDD